jgi:hypothetical protein
MRGVYQTPMSVQALYPFTGTIMVIGLGAMAYGVQSLSPILFFEGVFLLWLGFSLMVNIMEDSARV